jgi:hypothetical protein
MAIAFPGEPVEYRAARNRLPEQEIELRRATDAALPAQAELPHPGARPAGDARPGRQAKRCRSASAAPGGFAEHGETPKQRFAAQR